MIPFGEIGFMTTIIAGALILLGLAVGFVIAWIIGVGSSGLFPGLLLFVAGAIIGFVVEWFIDEAYRRNRELQLQLSLQPNNPSQDTATNHNPPQQDDTASQALADFLKQREQEVHELRDQVESNHTQMDALRDKFEAYQRSHPDDFTMVKGIGPVYQRKLRDMGINSFDQLIKADPDRLRRMLDVKSWQRVDVESWIQQARDWAHRSE
jgi:predicted flap endonuclease-1-like 5' DNA nuclease